MKNVYENPAVEVIYLDVLDVLSGSFGDIDIEDYAGGRNPITSDDPIIWG